MPDVTLETATDPLSPDMRVVIKYSVEVEGLPVYQETYDARGLARELEADRERFTQLWLRRAECAIRCLEADCFSARLTKCLAQGVPDQPRSA
ncbi:MAG: hypothetical protein SFU53_12950 [Terrimicrobiaceae bacterium]|nr:hypothetical protein [Terrimicrobiaceae bacterium]